jgi:uncharacterized membrane protein (DUF2068 family)
MTLDASRNDMILARGIPNQDMQTNQQLRSALDLRGRKGQVKVLRAVASFEIAKGLVVLAAGCGILMLLHKDTSEVAENFLQLLHISPDHRFARMFLAWADTLTDEKLWAVSGVSLAYSTLRFIEAYGLWNARGWAEWVALISGALYLPIELREMIFRPNAFHASLLAINLGVVLYMVHLRMLSHREKQAEEAHDYAETHHES